ncbi:MAG: uncharacterized protein KVP18_001111 [Porospora cf. gigantea A]|uniref:uncharacterized protein n=1 Tax=Porospora cf. gigantea A TaxID=2853593 RepID=UPI00355948CA|nr:MAG: hypothetical protein KVP18_001111 [Porospora cf. gigantea A]
MPKTSPPTGRAIHYNTQAPVHPSTERINGIGNRVHDEMIRQMTPTAIADTFAPMAQACQVSGLLRDCWRSKFRFRKRPNPEQSVRLLFRVLQGSHQNIVPPANPKPRARVGQSQHLVDTASHLSTFFNDFAEKFWNVDEELGGRILSALERIES